ncbi:FecR domain-containing protein [Pararhodobacter zhoushanensis]|uniref:FecR domain-containing protein n=1 Tax=Pararhodobacter zhoushanensis TaxID=2479545 RepID=A0ABT3GZQ9_9RHOB|nr:FecR domain-containing protein [Pararhodobacter zhoushanensis]MCW1933031.1 FecR domain-containing protein [Pararhodobacter zhoushanensis]
MTVFSRRTLLMTAAGLPLSLPAFASTPSRLGEVLETTGPGDLIRDGQRLPLAPGLALQDGDTAETGDSGLALLLLDERTRIALGTNSHIELATFLSEIGGTIRVGGAMVFDRPDDLPALDARFVTAFGEIGVRGTRFFVGWSRGDYAVFVQRGQVSVSNAGVTRLLNAGEGCTLSDGAPSEVTLWGEARIDEAFASLGLSRD